MYCNKCGVKLEENALFCTNCGAKIGGMPTAVEEVVQPEADKPKGKMLITILIILIILLLGGIGGGVYFIGSYQKAQSFEGRGESNPEEENEADDEPNDGADDAADDGDLQAGEEVQEEAPVFQGERKPVNLNIHQVDNSNFPEITFYASVVDEDNNVVDNLNISDFTVQEIDTNGNISNVTINDVYRVLNEDTISVNLVLDASGSMDDYNKMQQAKNAANALISKMDLSGGDRAEIISFDTYVYLQQDFTSQELLLTEAVNNIDTNGMTALYDALYAGLYQTYFESGAKCVIGFTDGMENASSYTFDDVVTMAQNTSIPLFIIGIGEEYDADELRRLATECWGSYYSANVNDLESILTDIYLSIYEQQQDYYVFKYTSTDTDNQNQFRDIVLSTSDSAEFYGSYTKEYIPQSDISGAFASDYMDWDYILDFSSQREVTEADLTGLSLAQLRIARNEIFARHGRQFKDSMLNQWFYSKTWYLNIPTKYSPDDFDRISPSPLTKLEIQNVGVIKDYEENLMNTSDIYPDAAYALLSDYDLALSKAVLRNAMAQVQNYPDTDILRQNKQLIQQAIDKEEIQY